PRRDVLRVPEFGAILQPVVLSRISPRRDCDRFTPQILCIVSHVCLLSRTTPVHHLRRHLHRWLPRHLHDHPRRACLLAVQHEQMFHHHLATRLRTAHGHLHPVAVFPLYRFFSEDGDLHFRFLARL